MQLSSVRAKQRDYQSSIAECRNQIHHYVVLKSNVLELTLFNDTVDDMYHTILSTDVTLNDR